VIFVLNTIYKLDVIEQDKQLHLLQFLPEILNCKEFVSANEIARGLGQKLSEHH
jgi:hypothetical protein